MAGSGSTPDLKKNDVAKGDPNDLPPVKKLPSALQEIVNNAEKDDTIYDELWEGTAPESTESNIRYAAYATRIRTALLSAQRYVAYTSDIGESFRPVAHPTLVRAAYGISWAYLAGDVAHEGYKAYCANQRTRHPELPREAVALHYSDARSAQPGEELVGEPGVVLPIEDYRTVMVQRAVFQGVASMGLPAFTIHSIVRYSGRALKDVKNVRVRVWGPIGLGLAAVPFLPYVFDKPVEDAVEFVFHTGFKAFKGDTAVGETPRTGREHQLEVKPKEKEA